MSNFHVVLILLWVHLIEVPKAEAGKIIDLTASHSPPFNQPVNQGTAQEFGFATGYFKPVVSRHPIFVLF